jgi:hypothetical protein
VKTLLVVASLVIGAAGMAQEPARISPLPCAHAHNDYEHARPLLDAWDQGFCSVEADVWLVDGQLLVAHTSNSLSRARTLQALYLEPLRKRVESNSGSVHAGGPTLTLLIDFKSDATNTYRTLLAVLKPYEAMLTTFHPDRTETRAVTVIISGNRPREAMNAEPVRHVGYDGRLDDLDRPVSPHFMPLISDAWTKHFKWRGTGPLPDGERSKLKALADRSHDQGRRIRFWAIPDSPAAWAELLDAGVDLVNTDKLNDFKDFYISNRIVKAKQGAEPAR